MSRERVRLLGVFMLAAVTTANLASFVVAAMLLDAVTVYVGVLLPAARDRRTVRPLVWDSWNVVRVAGFIVLGSVSVAPIASRFGYPVPAAQGHWLLYMGGIGLALDLIPGLLPSGPCRRLLRLAVTLGPQAEKG